MGKKIGWVMLVMMFLFVSNVGAHTSLEESSPKDGEVVTKPLDEITLSFGGLIEETSSLHLFDGKGKEIPFKSVSVENNRLIGEKEENLPNDTYKLEWKIVGEDGHVIEGEISFTVNVQQLKEPIKPTVEKEQVVKTENKEQEQPKRSMSLLFLIPLFLLGGGTILWLARR